MDLFTAKALSEDHLIVAFQYLILPMFARTNRDAAGNLDFMDPALPTTVVERLMEPPEAIAIQLTIPVKIELLQLATLLIWGVSSELKLHRKELIKFGWNNLKREEPQLRCWAFPNVASFLEVYPAPEKIVLQVKTHIFHTLIHSHKASKLMSSPSLFLTGFCSNVKVQSN